MLHSSCVHTAAAYLKNGWIVRVLYRLCFVTDDNWYSQWMIHKFTGTIKDDLVVILAEMFSFHRLLLSESEGRKLCKKVKVDPSSKSRGTELLHYKWVTRQSAGSQTLSSSCRLLPQLAHHTRSVPVHVPACCVLQRWDVPHRIQQAGYLQG